MLQRNRGNARVNFTVPREWSLESCTGTLLTPEVCLGRGSRLPPPNPINLLLLMCRRLPLGGAIQIPQQRNKVCWAISPFCNMNCVWLHRKFVPIITKDLPASHVCWHDRCVCVQCMSAVYQKNGSSLSVDKQLCRREQSEVLRPVYSQCLVYFYSSILTVNFILVRRWIQLC